MPLSTPPCSHPPLPVRTVAVQSGNYSHMARPYATIVAQVDANGRVTATRVVESSGDAAYDAAAEKAMDAWTFEPASEQCKPAAGTAQYAVGPRETAFDDPCNHYSTVIQAAMPDYPDDAKGSGLGRITVKVVVQVGADGGPTSASISTSSGNMYLDRAAIRAAIGSNYVPRVANCAPVPSQYLYSVTFDPNG